MVSSLNTEMVAVTVNVTFTTEQFNDWASNTLIDAFKRNDPFVEAMLILVNCPKPPNSDRAYRLVFLTILEFIQGAFSSPWKGMRDLTIEDLPATTLMNLTGALRSKEYRDNFPVFSFDEEVDRAVDTRETIDEKIACVKKIAGDYIKEPGMTVKESIADRMRTKFNKTPAVYATKFGKDMQTCLFPVGGQKRQFVEAGDVMAKAICELLGLANGEPRLYVKEMYGLRKDAESIAELRDFLSDAVHKHGKSARTQHYPSTKFEEAVFSLFDRYVSFLLSAY